MQLTAMVVSKGLHPGGVVRVPSTAAAVKAATDAVVLDVFPPAPNGAEQVIHLTYSPPGAACLPTPLTLVPVQMK